MESLAATWMRIAVEIVACLIMVGGIVVVFIERFRSRRGGTRTLQLLVVSLVLPTLLILALEDVLDRQTTAALIGVIVGYSLAGIGRDGPGQS